MAEEFVKAVEDGVRLSKRIYFGKDRSVAPPRPMPGMEKSSPQSYLPSAPMVYAVIPDPAVVDNPDIPSYQPHVHGRCDPPAFIPLQMNSISLQADCVLDTAFVTVSGSWRVHCVMGTRFCHCRVAIPMGEQGSILGVEVEAPRKSYSTKVVTLDDKDKDMEREMKLEDGGFIKPHIFTFTIPEIDGGSNISIKVRWSQKLLYQDGQYTLTIPYSFPEFVTPAGKKMAKKERIKVNVNAGPGTEILCKTISHPLKELRRLGGQLGFLYDTDVLTWSSCDFNITYSVSVSPSGGVILQSPSMVDIDQREMFCLSLFPGNKHNRKVFRKEVLFVVDISESMQGKPLEDTKNALVAAILKLDQGDFFNVIAFNDEIHLFSSSLELATEKTLDRVTEWMSANLVAQGGTNMLLPLNQALQMISNNGTPIIFLITDGAVENERQICDVMMSHLSNEKLTSPRLHTFGIGSFCNHYFLRMLATMGKGNYDAAYDEDSIEVRLKGFFSRAFSTIVENITIDGLENLEDLEMYPSCIPDLLSERPVIITGRYSGDFPSTIQVKGILADMSNFSVDLKVEEVKEIPLDKILAKQQIELCTAQAWFSEDKGLEEEIAKVSMQSSVISEFTCMILLETDKGKKGKTVSAEKGKGKKGASHSSDKKENKQVSTEPDCQKRTVLGNFKSGFGNLTATKENTPLGSNDVRLPDPGEKFVMAASNCCGKMCGHCCCLCCIQMCSRVNDHCAIVFTQLCGALSCLGCYYCCEACCGSE